MPSKCKNCSKRATHNFSNKKNPILCKEHSEIGMINVTAKTCLNCSKKASFNFNGEKFAKYCKTHSEQGMINVIAKTCLECDTQPRYNFSSEIKAIYCKEHAKKDMINVIDKKCLKCNKRPNFNKKGETKAIYCKEHAEEDMDYINIKTCLKCSKQPSFNFSGELKAIYCKEHAEKDMIDIKHKKCLKCDKRPNYNFKEEKDAKYCLDHAEDGMINILDKKCLECDVIPTYNFPDKKEALYCVKHAKDKMVDIKHRVCIECNSRANFRFVGQNTTHCSKHKKPFMVNKIYFCIENDCKDLATHSNFSKPERCEIHAQENEISFIKSRCKNCNNEDILDKELLCKTFCSPHKLVENIKFKDKIKEKSMLNFLDRNLNLDEYKGKIKFVSDDKIINILCNKFRPDRIYDCSTHILTIECDEHQHKDRKFCENFESLDHFEETRLYEVYNAYGNIPLFTIRFNPDSFKSNSKINKSFNIHQRYKILKKWVEYVFNLEIYDQYQPVRYIKLFFDNYDENNDKFTEINPLKLL